MTVSHILGKAIAPTWSFQCRSPQQHPGLNRIDALDLELRNGGDVGQPHGCTAELCCSSSPDPDESRARGDTLVVTRRDIPAEMTRQAFAIVTQMLERTFFVTRSSSDVVDVDQFGQLRDALTADHRLQFHPYGCCHTA